MTSPYTPEPIDHSGSDATRQHPERQPWPAPPAVRQSFWRTTPGYVSIGALVLMVVAIAISAALAANRGSSTAQATTPIEEHLVAEPTASTEASPASNPSATPVARVLKLGENQRFSQDGFTLEVAALAYRHGDGYEGVQVRTCNRGPVVSVSRNPWVLGYSNFEQLHDIDTIGGGLPAPAYQDRDLATGQCTKGWVNFERIDGQKPDGIQYAPEGAEPIRWHLS